MALTSAEQAAEQTRIAREARLADAYRARGQSGAAERYSTNTPQTPPQGIRKDELVDLLNKGNRQEIASRLRSQAEYASNFAAAQRSKGKSRAKIREYEDIARLSQQAADRIEAGTGPLSNSERVAAGRSRSPEADLGELRRRYGSKEQRARELQRERSRDAAQAAGYKNARAQREATGEANRQAAVDQRNVFLASEKQIPGAFGRYAVEKLGYEPNVQPEETLKARRQLVSEGKAQVFDPATGKAFRRQPGGILAGVRTEDDLQRLHSSQEVALAQSGEANFQDTQGRFYQASAPEESVFKPEEPTPETELPTPPRTFKFLGFDTGIKVYGSDTFSQEARELRSENPVRSAGESFLAFSTGVFEGVSYPIQQPKEFLIGLKNLVVHPIQTVKGIISEGKANPEGTVGQLAGTALFFKGVAKATPSPVANAVPRPTIESFEIPQASRATPTRVTLYHGTTAESASKILKEGLKPNKATGNVQLAGKNDPNVYLIDSVEGAKNFGDTVLSVRLTKAQAARAKTFSDINELTGARELIVDYPGTIPAKQVGPSSSSFVSDISVRGAERGPTTVTAVGVRAGSRGVTIASRVKTPEGRSYSFGRPDVTRVLENLPEGKDVKIGGTLETSILEKNLRAAEQATPRAREVIPVAQSIIRKTQSTRAKLPENIILETERLPPEGVKVVLDIAKQEEATVFGSFSRRQTSPEFNTPRDIDVRLSDASPEVIQRVTEQTIRDLRSKGITARERADTPGALEVLQADGQYAKAVEFKGKNQVPGEDVVPEQILGFQKEGSPVKIAGQKFTTLNEELRGVTQGVIRVRKEKGVLDVSPPPKRAKDVGSLITSAEVLRQNQIIERPGLAADIQKIRDFYTKSETPSASQVVVADFSPSPGARSSRTIVSSPIGKRDGTDLSPSREHSPSPRGSPSASSRGRPLSPVPSSPVPADFSPLVPLSPPSQSPRSSPKPSPVPRSPVPASATPSPLPASPSPGSPATSPSPPSPPPQSPAGPSPVSSPFGPPSPSTPSPAPRRTPAKPSEPLFDVEVRRQGQFRTFTTQGLRLTEASAFAQSVVDTTAARSFKVVERGTGRPITGSDKAKLERSLSPGRYRKSKSDQNIFVERSAFAINTPGEKGEIRPKSVFSNSQNRSPFGGRLNI